MVRFPVRSSNGRDSSGCESSGVSQSPQCSQASPDGEPQSLDGWRNFTPHDSQLKYRHPRITTRWSRPASASFMVTSSCGCGLLIFGVMRMKNAAYQIAAKVLSPFGSPCPPGSEARPYVASPTDNRQGVASPGDHPGLVLSARFPISLVASLAAVAPSNVVHA